MGPTRLNPGLGDAEEMVLHLGIWPDLAFQNFGVTKGKSSGSVINIEISLMTISSTIRHLPNYLDGQAYDRSILRRHD